MDEIFCTGHASPLGPMLLAATPHGLRGVWFEGQRHAPATTGSGLAFDTKGSDTKGSGLAFCLPRQKARPDPGYPGHPGHPLLREAARQLRQYFDGERTGFDLPLDPRAGTPFQQSVWRALAAIPPGRTTTYAALACTVGRPQAARAVGAAVGRNPWSIVVPCHRVVGTDGTLTGYAGGLARKIALLRLEGACVPTLA